jgi:hypothetical protein
MRIASSTSQNCGISYFIFDDIASLAGSADAQNVDPLILSDICKGLKNENPYCTDLRFLGVEARARAEGITVIPRMVDQVQHFDVCSVVNNRQTGEMKLQVRTHTNSVSGINMGLNNLHSHLVYEESTFDWSLQLANPCCKCLIYNCSTLEVKVFR